MAGVPGIVTRRAPTASTSRTRAGRGPRTSEACSCSRATGGRRGRRAVRSRRGGEFRPGGGRAQPDDHRADHARRPPAPATTLPPTPPRSRRARAAATVIDDDSCGDVETSARSTRPRTASTSTRASRACACRSTTPSRSARRNDFGEISVLADDGPARASARRAAGSSSAPNDFNPERICSTTCSHRCRRRTSATASPARGAASWTTPSATSSCSTHGARRADGRRPEAEVTAAPALPNELASATFNVENLDPADRRPSSPRSARSDRRQPALARPRRPRGGPGQQRPDQRRRRPTRRPR